jgi:ribosomal protein S12 methylthiotransferase
MPEIDFIAGVGGWDKLPRLLRRLADGGERVVKLDRAPAHYEDSPARLVSTPPHRAYLKVAEGCSNACAYCIIGRLRGPFRSRALGAILDEAESLAANGAKELSLVAQDLTLYGRDLSPASSLPKLLRALDRAARGVWVRLLYAHPARVDRSLARALAECPSVVPYLDMPLQHVSDRVLARMNRPQTKASSQAAVDRLHAAVPGIALRTTFLVGHPGETEADFAELLDFVKRNRFEHVGAFVWSPEEGTPSHAQREWVDDSMKQDRLDRLMRLQQRLSRALLRQRIGQTTDVLIEEALHKHHARAFSHVGRTPQQAPEVDGVIYIRAPREDSCQPGDIVRARIVKADVYDLFAESVAE